MPTNLKSLVSTCFAVKISADVLSMHAKIISNFDQLGIASVSERQLLYGAKFVHKTPGFQTRMNLGRAS